MKRVAQAVAVVAVVLVSRDASAHLVSTRFGELYSGILHPLISLQHLVPWLALGMLAGLQQTATARPVLWAMPLFVGLGALLGGLLPASGFITWLNVSSFAVLGVLVALAVRLGQPLLLALTAVVGVSHGLANAAPELDARGQALYVLGVAIAAYVLIALVTAGSHVLAGRAKWGSIALRAAGSWIAAIGLIFAGFSMVKVP